MWGYISVSEPGTGVFSDEDSVKFTAGKLLRTGLPRSWKNTWKMNFFPGQGKVREFGGWPGKFSKDLESQGNVREFENMAMAGGLQKIYFFCSRGERMYFLMR